MLRKLFSWFLRLIGFVLILVGLLLFSGEETFSYDRKGALTSNYTGGFCSIVLALQCFVFSFRKKDQIEKEATVLDSNNVCIDCKQIQYKVDCSRLRCAYCHAPLEPIETLLEKYPDFFHKTK